MMRRALIAAVLLLALACRRTHERQAVTIATTPDVAGTGVDAMLAARFSRESQVPVRVIVTEERMIPGVKADIVLTTSPVLRRALPVSLATTFAYDDLVLAGPKRDPARVRKAATAADALHSIALRDRAYCSAADVPELRHREAELWAASGKSPKDDRRFRLCRGTAAEVLAEASRRGAYTLTHRSTFDDAGASVKLVALLEGTPMLHNDYAALLVTPPTRNRNAQWFMQWLMSYRGRETIERYRFGEGRRFFVRE